ncbi:MAG: PrsW family intramembrane metalloprotease [Bacilli bacterium]|nr:PrsW family intramembrane metalloprotease [Bacilli bacterium]
MGDILTILDFPKLVTVLILTVVPSILLLMLILYSDRRSREPVLMILICLFSGAFTICLSLIIDKIIIKTHIFSGDLFTYANSYNVYRIMILAGVEEYAKLLILYIFLYRNRAYDDIYDGFVYSSIIALSFSLIETFMYVFSESNYSDMTSLAILRNFTAIPLHVACGIVMGYFVSLEKFAKTRKAKLSNMIKALFMPTLIHTIYNVFFSVVSLSNTSTSSMLVVILFVLSIYFIGIMFIYKTYSLNKIFVSNGYYPNKYKYLMRRNEFIYRESRKFYGA